MKKQTILFFNFLLTLIFFSGYSQINVYFGQKNMTYPQKGGIYETKDDLLKDNLKDVGVYGQAYSKLKLGVQQTPHSGEINFGETYYKLKGASFFGYKDDKGNRYRIINGMPYVVLCAGAKCLYAMGYMNREVYDDKIKNKIEKCGPYADITIWYSDGLDGELVKIQKWDKTPSKEAAEKLFVADMELATKYMLDTSDDYDPHDKKSPSDHLERIIYYTDIYNKQHQ